jgi:hypothetical protein
MAITKSIVYLLTFRRQTANTDTKAEEHRREKERPRGSRPKSNAKAQRAGG